MVKTVKRVRAKRRPNDRQTAFRMPSELVARIDAFASRMAEKSPGVRVSRADATRRLLHLGLDAVDGERTERSS